MYEDQEREDSGPVSEPEGLDASDSGEVDTEDEIVQAQELGSKSKKTLKRKLRATSPTQFGATLNELLAGQPNADIPLSLPRRLERQREKEKAESSLRKAQGRARRDAEELGRITDIIGGWGVENERSLRKVAQRGGETLNSRGHRD
jgi:hypothetical protein